MGTDDDGTEEMKRQHPYRGFLLFCCGALALVSFLFDGVAVSHDNNSVFGGGASVTDKAVPFLDDAAVLEALGCGGGGGDSDPADCVEREVKDRSEKKRAQDAIRDELVAAAWKRSSKRSGKRSGLQLGVPFVPPSPRDPEFAPKDEWKNIGKGATATGMAYPNIEITGLPKAGTSHLYSILTHRPDTVGFHKAIKEFCSHKNTSKEFYDWHDANFRENVEKRTTKFKIKNSTAVPYPVMTVNGCISLGDNLLRYDYLWSSSSSGEEEEEGRRRRRPGKQKYLVLFRDPADWMWASWNFWKDPRIDTSDESTGMWTDRDTDYRSPELFHEMFLAGPEKSLIFAERIEQFREVSVRGVDQLRNAAGPENVLMLKNEDMRPDVANAEGGLLDKLSDFTGLDRSMYDEKVVGKMTNCNDNKGRSCDDKSASTTNSRYGITGGRPMLPETRELVYLYFWEECKIWSEEFGITYPDCLNVLP